MSTVERQREAFDRIIGWMRAHGASVLAENLAEGASAGRLEEAERAAGFPLPPELRTLWTLHDGQKEEMNGFVEWLDLFDTQRAVAERETVLMFVGFLRQSPELRKDAGLTPEELASDRWVPFAGRDSESLVVSAVSGRVFDCGKDAPPLHVLASSVTEWLERYARRVVADDFSVEEGFGDCYLSERDRAAEAREAERTRRNDERERYRAQTPLLTQLADAVRKQDGDDCQRVLERAHAKGPVPFAEAMAALLASDAEEDVVATALRPLLSALTLTPDQWVRVAAGGARLDNNAVVDAAVAKAAGCSTQALERFGASIVRAPEYQHARMRAVLQRLSPTRRPWWRFWS